MLKPILLFLRERLIVSSIIILPHIWGTYSLSLNFIKSGNWLLFPLSFFTCLTLVMIFMLCIFDMFFWKSGNDLLSVQELKPDFIGDQTCSHNANSSYIRCAINPTGPCSGCNDYEIKEGC